jgi:hypothetical protein
MLKWLRKVRVTFGSAGGSSGLMVNPSELVEPIEIKVGFHASRGISGTANTASISLWNLNPEFRQAVGKELDQVTLEAGHEGNIGVIFTGQLRDVEHRREGMDIVTTLSSGDGDKAFRNTVISRTFPAGTPVTEVVEGIYGEMEKQGVGKGEWVFPSSLSDYKRPYSIAGTATRELDVLGRTHGFYWNVQNGVMEIIPSDGALPGVLYLDDSSGLISTTVTDNGVRVTALLDPEARPNRQMQVNSTVEPTIAGENGVFRISQVDFYGDNRDGAFEMSITGETMQGSVVDQGIVIPVLRALPV